MPAPAIAALLFLLGPHDPAATAAPQTTEVPVTEVLVSAWGTHDVHRVDIRTGEDLGQFVATNSGGLHTPNGLAWGPDGNLYVASADTSQVLRYDGRTGAFIDIFASEPINRASFIAFGADSHLYVCSTNDDRVLRFDGTTGAFLDTFIEGPELDWPAGLNWREGELLVSAFGNHALLRYDGADGDYLGRLTDQPAKPLYTRVEPDGSVWVAEYAGNRLARYDGTTGDLLGAISGGGLNGPVGQVLLPDGSLLVASFNNNRLIRFDPGTGQALSTWAGITRPNDLLLVPPRAPGDAGGPAPTGVHTTTRVRP